MARINSILESEDRYDLTPMIDVVFLLLIYFMFLPLQQEADISLRLPSLTPPEKSEETPLPNKHIIEIYPNGVVLLNGAPMDNRTSREMPDLVDTLDRLRLSAERMDTDTIIEIQADPDSEHQRSIDVLNACALANIKKVSFATTTR